MATSQRDVRNRIDAVKNIRKITRAMEMVAAARLLPFLIDLRTSASSVDALASTLSPVGAMICA